MLQNVNMNEVNCTIIYNFILFIFSLSLKILFNLISQLYKMCGSNIYNQSLLNLLDILNMFYNI